jgi:hypothetical protein
MAHRYTDFDPHLMHTEKSEPRAAVTVAFSACERAEYVFLMLALLL